MSLTGKERKIEPVRTGPCPTWRVSKDLSGSCHCRCRRSPKTEMQPIQLCEGGWKGQANIRRVARGAVAVTMAWNRPQSESLAVYVTDRQTDRPVPDTHEYHTSPLSLYDYAPVYRKQWDPLFTASTMENCCGDLVETKCTKGPYSDRFVRTGARAQGPKEVLAKRLFVGPVSTYASENSIHQRQTQLQCRRGGLRATERVDCESRSMERPSAPYKARTMAIGGLALEWYFSIGTTAIVPDNWFAPLCVTTEIIPDNALSTGAKLSIHIESPVPELTVVNYLSSQFWKVGSVVNGCRRGLTVLLCRNVTSATLVIIRRGPTAEKIRCRKVCKSRLLREELHYLFCLPHQAGIALHSKVLRPARRYQLKCRSLDTQLSGSGHGSSTAERSSGHSHTRARATPPPGPRHLAAANAKSSITRKKELMSYQVSSTMKGIF
ncbi:hypothetical protein J6590_063631 [Homalodisca vitripennis]|nr:hypothetical protein J6590_063631 [Homalodisca vitripennis]